MKTFIILFQNLFHAFPELVLPTLSVLSSHFWNFLKKPFNTIYSIRRTIFFNILELLYLNSLISSFTVEKFLILFQNIFIDFLRTCFTHFQSFILALLELRDKIFQNFLFDSKNVFFQHFRTPSSKFLDFFIPPLKSFNSLP